MVDHENRRLCSKFSPSPHDWQQVMANVYMSTPRLSVSLVSSLIRSTELIGEVLFWEEDRAATSVSWQRSLASGTPYRTRIPLRGFDGVAAAVELIAFGHTVCDGEELWLFTGLHVNGATQPHPWFDAQYKPL